MTKLLLLPMLRANSMTRLLILVLLVSMGSSTMAQVPATGTPRGLGAQDVVGLVGGAQLTAAAEAGYLEALLATRAAGGTPRLRDFSWEGDTVFHRPRPLNFPSLTQLLKRSHVSVVLLQFGQMESLGGSDALPAFFAAYEAVLREVGAEVPRIILVTPTPFAAGGPLDAAAVEARNRQLAGYVAEIRRLGEAQRRPVVDLFTPLMASTPASTRQPTSPDGLQLTDSETRLTAQLMARLGVPGKPEEVDWLALEPVREAAQVKNRLWTRYWRPTNWAFLAGDRTDQPSSRDHRDRNIRWFPAEMEEFVPLIEAADAEVAKRAEAVNKAEATR